MPLKICMLAMLLYTTTSLATVEYVVKLERNLRHVNVETCFAGLMDETSPRDLYIHQDTRAYISDSRWNGKPVRIRGRRLTLPGDAREGCLRYRARLQDSAGRWGGHGGDFALTESKEWLLSPQENTDAVIRFETPVDYAVSHPWPSAAAYRKGGYDWFRLAETSASWSNNVAFGRFRIHRIPVANTYLRMAILPSSPRMKVEQATAWVDESAQAALTSHGMLPQREPQVLITPVGRQREAIPFARVLRGGGIGLQFFVDPGQPLKHFSDDWKPTHEFAHLLLPYISRRDAWLSEGLASYYQNVLRARDGRLSETQAWDKLLAGFDRGRRGVTSNRTLAEEASGMHRNRSYRRVYWSGAAMLFIADVELRKQTNGRQSLDTALAGLVDCCMALGKVWYGIDMMKQLDEITDTTIFSTVYQRYTRSRKFPDVDQTLNALGVSERFGRLRLNEQAPLSEIRHSIMAVDHGG